MRRDRLVYSVLVLLLSWCVSWSEEPKLDRLVVYGDGFSFGVKEPSGWKGDTTKASEIGANIVFYRDGETYKNAVALIRVRVGKKVDEDTAADLAYDVNDYKKRSPGVRFGDIAASHPKYVVYPKLFFVPGKFYEYVAYLNPGPGIPKLFSVAMYKNTAEATPEELAAYREVLASVVLLGPSTK